MRSRRDPADPDTTEHISLADLAPFSHADLREMEISRVEILFASCESDPLMSHYYESIPSSISLYGSNYDTIGNREYWSSDRGPDIDGVVAAVIFSVVEPIAPHICSDIGVVLDERSLGCTRRISE